MITQTIEANYVLARMSIIGIGVLIAIALLYPSIKYLFEERKGTGSFIAAVIIPLVIGTIIGAFTLNALTDKTEETKREAYDQVIVEAEEKFNVDSNHIVLIEMSRSYFNDHRDSNSDYESAQGHNYCVYDLQQIAGGYGSLTKTFDFKFVECKNNKGDIVR